ncbi:cob(I)yrinic acid a,c-diamide adenosyltransferase [Alteromonas sediminis]|uniref:Corrinoid adenosyltransferase n=1 Tax=Alteromonas sediminis TaxID=2259342 RepID=A0A3N5Z8N6_9ALTE|nr:cob(I)yrinic acid a,c-diamide adenosyltransferase [Alteromonas sediminis]RPJ67254.1 cob(I)yrinic acid a,c-diamide adenosyltransferase [Alteromonas sediminis]
MKIYTRGGDKGATHVYVNKAVRVTKDDAIIEVYGALDELNAQMGLLRAQLEQSRTNADDKTSETLLLIQRAIFEAGYALSATSQLTQQHIDWLEEGIDHMQSKLPQQTAFILPGGTLLASQAHVCRTVCRRAERAMVALTSEHEVSDIAMAFVNRLSDWLFVFARLQNHLIGEGDVLVRPD